MCFAPEADAVAGVAIVAIGVDTLRHVSEPKQLVLAALPLLFGLHQLIEAFVWWGFQGHIPESVERVAVWAWLLFAFVALPILMPVAVDLIEPRQARRRIINALVVLGTVVGVALAIGMFRGPINAEIEGHRVAYQVDAVSHGGALTWLYVIATCGALLASSYRDIATLGALNLVAVPVLMWLTVSGFVSLWCFWAAIMSIVINYHLRRVARTRPRPALTRLATCTSESSRSPLPS